MELKLDVNMVQEVALLGIRRALLFERMARSTEYIAENINKLGHEEFFKFDIWGEANDSNIDQFRSAYFEWIRLNAVREIAERFYLYVDEVLIWLELLSKYPDGQLLGGDLDDIKKEIIEGRLGFADKIKKIKVAHRIKIPADHQRAIDFLTQIRDAITHAGGMVTPRHFTHRTRGNKGARVEWITMRLFIKDNDGKTLKVTPGTYVEKGGSVYLKVENSHKEFSYYSALSFTQEEVKLLGFSMYLVLTNLGAQLQKIISESNIVKGTP